MGLDIYFYKIDKKYADYPMNTLSETINADAKKKFAKKCDKWLKALENVTTEEYDQVYERVVTQLGKDPMFKRYSYPLDRLEKEKPNFKQFKEWLEYEAETYFQVSDCYFRKVNFLYAFFKEDMENECCLCRCAMFLTHEHFVVIFLDKDSDGELYHDFIGCDGFDEPCFEGVDDFGQTLRVYTLE